METKICTKCHIEKNISEFYKSGKYYNSICKKCKIQYNCLHAKNNEKIKKYQKQYRQNNRQKIALKDIKYKEKNKNKLKEYRKEYYIKNKERIIEYRNNNKETIKEKAKEYYLKNKQNINNKHKKWLKDNKEKQREYDNNRRKNDSVYKIKKQIRNLIRQSFIRKGKKKQYKSEEILGCNINFFIKYLRETFINNYGYEWDGKEEIHIDHIIPLATAKTEKEVLNLCHYTNLQLLKAKDNLAKSSKIVRTDILE